MLGDVRTASSSEGLVVVEVGVGTEIDVLAAVVVDVDVDVAILGGLGFSVAAPAIIILEFSVRVS